MTATLHKHNWRKLSDYNRFEWRCTNALSVNKTTNDYIYKDGETETGCLGTLVYWHLRKVFVFCAPGAPLTEMRERPVDMIIDQDYLDRQASFAESLRRLAA